MAYDPPTLAELRTSVARELGDPETGAFTPAEIDDFINDGIAELNQIKPRETISTVTELTSGDPPISTLDTLDLSYVWKVELVSTDDRRGTDVIPADDPEARNMTGWRWYAGRLILPPRWLATLQRGFDAGTFSLEVYGYGEREPLSLDEEVADFDHDDERLVRRFCVLRGFRKLLADRALFQQWQTQANNADVSPTQLTNMAQVAEAEWSRIRARNYVVRHPVVSW